MYAYNLVLLCWIVVLPSSSLINCFGVYLPSITLENSKNEKGMIRKNLREVRNVPLLHFGTY